MSRNFLIIIKCDEILCVIITVVVSAWRSLTSHRMKVRFIRPLHWKSTTLTDYDTRLYCECVYTRILCGMIARGAHAYIWKFVITTKALDLEMCRFFSFETVRNDCSQPSAMFVFLYVYFSFWHEHCFDMLSKGIFEHRTKNN